VNGVSRDSFEFGPDLDVAELARLHEAADHSSGYVQWTRRLLGRGELWQLVDLGKFALRHQVAPS
jgi:hypothetical protein